MSSRATRTRERLLAAAVELFATQGYDETTAAQVAARAGVTEMTFFRHFPTKEDALIADPYDPVMAAAVTAQPRELGPLRRVSRGMRLVWAGMPDEMTELVRTRVGIVARTPSLRSAMWRAMRQTEDSLTEALVESGEDALAARAASAAVLAAVTVGLLDWALSEGDLPSALHPLFDLFETPATTHEGAPRDDRC